MKKYIYTKNQSKQNINFNKLNYGNWGVKSISHGYISEKHLNLIKFYFNKFVKKNTYIKYNFIFNKIYTKKPLGSRLGGGKGNIFDKKFKVVPGSILIEIYNVPTITLFKVIKLISYKLNLKLILIKLWL